MYIQYIYKIIYIEREYIYITDIYIQQASRYTTICVPAYPYPYLYVYYACRKDL
jgi:hypothetical protein